MKLSKSICLIDSSFPLESDSFEIFKSQNLIIAIGDYEKILNEIHRYNITHYYFINLAKNSLFPLIDYSKINCRIEFGAIIRDDVKLKEMERFKIVFADLIEERELCNSYGCSS